MNEMFLINFRTSLHFCIQENSIKGQCWLAHKNTKFSPSVFVYADKTAASNKISVLNAIAPKGGGAQPFVKQPLLFTF